MAPRGVTLSPTPRKPVGQCGLEMCLSWASGPLLGWQLQLRHRGPAGRKGFCLQPAAAPCHASPRPSSLPAHCIAPNSTQLLLEEQEGIIDRNATSSDRRELISGEAASQDFAAHGFACTQLLAGPLGPPGICWKPLQGLVGCLWHLPEPTPCLITVDLMGKWLFWKASRFVEERPGPQGVYSREQGVADPFPSHGPSPARSPQSLGSTRTEATSRGGGLSWSWQESGVRSRLRPPASRCRQTHGYVGPHTDTPMHTHARPPPRSCHWLSALGSCQSESSTQPGPEGVLTDSYCKSSPGPCQDEFKY